MSTFDYQQWRKSSAVTPEMLDACLDRLAAVDAENRKLTRRNGELRGTITAYLATIKRKDATIADREASKAEAEAELAALKADSTSLRKRLDDCLRGHYGLNPAKRGPRAEILGPPEREDAP